MIARREMHLPCRVAAQSISYCVATAINTTGTFVLSNDIVKLMPGVGHSGIIMPFT